MDLGSVGAADARLQVQHPGKAVRAGGPGTPGALTLTLRMRIAESEVADRRRHRLAIDPPLQVGREFVDRDDRVLEHAGHFQRTVSHPQLALAAGLVQVEIQRRSANARRARCGRLAGNARRRLGGDFQRHRAALDFVFLQRVDRTLPPGLHGFHQAFGLVGGQGRMGRRPERQPARDLAQRQEVELVGAKLAAGRLAPLGLGPLKKQVAARPDLALASREVQVMGLHFEAAGQPLPADAARDGLQGQRRQLRPQPRAHVRQHEVRDAARQLAALDVDPRPQCTMPFADFHAQVGITPQLGHVDTQEVAMDLPVPSPPAAVMDGQKRLSKEAPQGEAFAPRPGWGGIQPQGMAPAAVSHHEVDRGQGERRGAALLVGPPYGAVADDELALAEEPVGGPAIAVDAGKVEPGNEDASVRGAPHVQFRAVDVQLVESQVPQGTRRKRRLHTRQAQRGAPLRIEQNHVAQLEGWNQAFAAGGDAADAHRYPQDPAGLDFQRGAKLTDSRHNPAVKRSPRQHQHQPCRQEKPQRPFRDSGVSFQRT